jgi:hypothetical protein
LDCGFWILDQLQTNSTDTLCNCRSSTSSLFALGDCSARNLLAQMVLASFLPLRSISDLTLCQDIPKFPVVAVDTNRALMDAGIQTRG